VAGKRILVVDDEPGVRSALEGILIDDGFEVRCVGSGEAALEASASEPFDALLLDVWLPGIDGLETLTRLRQAQVDAEVVMISGHGTIETAVRATKLGAFDFVEKPLSLDKTLLVLRNALRQRALERRNRALLAQLDRDTEIVGSSLVAERLRRDLAAAAASVSAVLVVGEPGSGRQMAVRRIHAAGSRSDRPFVEVPCGALEMPAAADALFGTPQIPSRIALAREGTLYLNGVDRLGVEVQERLAAWLGSEEGRDADVRVVATAGPGGRTSASLAARLGLRIEVPPLRDRRQDVSELVTHYMEQLAREYGREPRPFTAEALAALRVYDWPGNVRELRNVVEQLLLAAPGSPVQAEDLPAALGGASVADVDLYGPFLTLDEGLAAFERYYLRRALAEERGDVELAARRVGKDLAWLESRLKEMGSAGAP